MIKATLYFLFSIVLYIVIVYIAWKMFGVWDREE